jgi:7,8-dihydro-6-hydroxymethylpterin dimethyltransferase
MNSSYCNICKKLVPTVRFTRDGKVYLRKECSACGPNETLISNDAVRSEMKRSLDVHVEHSYEGCDLDCPSCGRHRNPKFTFLNVTNHCNMNCPICFDNVPGLGFDFDPPMEYFDNVFRELAALERPPIVCLFGGEPTTRKDLFDIIALSRNYGLRSRVFTNGLRLADEEYCRALLKTRTEIMFSYDGSSPGTYVTLRGNAKAMELKQKALDNISKNAQYLRRPMTLITVLAKDMNDSEMPEILQLCHDRRDIIGTAFLMPLVHTWDSAKWQFDPPRMTTEDVEQIVQNAFPGYRLEFLPLGLIHELASALRAIGKESDPYAGAHPNCESMYFLSSNGEQWLPAVHFLKKSESAVAQSILELGQRHQNREARWQKSLGGRALGAVKLRNAALRTAASADVLALLARTFRVGRLFKGRGVAKWFHAGAAAVELTLGLGPSMNVRRKHMTVQEGLRVVILPLEDNCVLETERLERCPTAQVYLDPESKKAVFVPLCAWKLHNRTILRSISEYYARPAAVAS